MNKKFKSNWTYIRDAYPPRQGYYLVSWQFKNKYHENPPSVDKVFFRGKTSWAKHEEYIYAWMPLPEVAEVIEDA